MGIFERIFNKDKPLKNVTENDASLQNYRHNIYDSELSQYSSLPRYYYIRGIKYDIDSPESVSEIPVCKTSFCINGERWGIDTVLRAHVYGYFQFIPDELKSACFSKNSEFSYTAFKTESESEKQARLKQKKEQLEKQEELSKISLQDMKQFDFSQFELSQPFYYNNMSIMLINSQDQDYINHKTVPLLDKYIREACSITGITENLLLSTVLIKYDTTQKVVGSQEITNYYTFFKCCPYTKTGKLSKYPLVLRYAHGDFNSVKNFFGDVYYMQDGSIGKARLIFWKEYTMYKIELACKGSTLGIKSVEKNQELLYKAQ